MLLHKDFDVNLPLLMDARFSVNLGGNILLHYLTNHLIINTLIN